MSDETRLKPTAGELEILRVLWDRGEATVRDVHAALADARGYTTILKLMQIMAEKGLVRRDERGRTHIYRPAVGEAQTQRTLVGDLLEKAFGGSSRKLVMALLSDRRAGKRELAEIRKLLDEIEGGDR